jgi:FixJ family two-component response regulator
MRTFTVAGGIQTFIALHEGRWLDDHAAERVFKDELSERDQVIAQSLVARGVLNKQIAEGRIFYTRNINRMVS